MKKITFFMLLAFAFQLEMRAQDTASVTYVSDRVVDADHYQCTYHFTTDGYHPLTIVCAAYLDTVDDFSQTVQSCVVSNYDSVFGDSVTITYSNVGPGTWVPGTKYYSSLTIQMGSGYVSNAALDSFVVPYATGIADEAATSKKVWCVGNVLHWSNLNEGSTIAVVDMLGQNILSQDLASPNGQIRLVGLRPGTYVAIVSKRAAVIKSKFQIE